MDYEDIEHPESTESPVPTGDEKRGGELQVAQHLSGLYENWFLDYASYVILERAVPHINDGLKPVHRRILHSMREMDDGRYNKVANIIGNTMKYHPHGDASIGDALVNLGQKDLLIDCQGNWGNIYTGDRAAAPRYIEARLSKFALEVLFNPKTTIWKQSYDGRNNEPVTLPVKFPLLLAQGVEGIAVGLASKILPHNFIELIDASIAYLRNKPFILYPDFQTGGLVDVDKYKDGQRGGKIRVRARIVQESTKLLKITELPFSKTTGNVIDSIILATDKGKIKIKKIDDNTSDSVEILLHLAPGVSPDQTIDALFAFTDCEVSISPNTCIVQDNKPRFVGVTEILKFTADQTVLLLKMELDIRKAELLELLHQSSLEKIFIENRIYRDIEKCESFEEVIVAIDEGLKPFVKDFIRDVTRDDIIRLTEIKIKRISKYNSFKADEQMKALQEELEKIEFHLANLIDYAVDYYKEIKKKYGKGKERKTELRNFESIDAATVAVANTKLYVNRTDGFVGTGLKKDEYVGVCSDIDDIIVFLADGNFMVTKVTPKTFVGKDIIHVDVFNKNDDRMTYNMVYRDGKLGPYYVKRFPVTGITRDKLYEVTSGTADSKVTYFTANPNGEAEVIRVYLRPEPKMKKTSLDFDFKNLAIKGRSAKGNLLTKKPIKKIVVKEDGVSTLGAVAIWYDETVKRLNTDDRGIYLGAFKGDDRILTITKTGYYQLYNFDLANHFDDHMIHIEKYDPRKVLSAVYVESTAKVPFVKRFYIEETDKKTCFVGDEQGKLIEYSLDYLAQMEITVKREKEMITELISLDEFTGIKSLKAKGKRLTADQFKSAKWAEPLPYEYPSIVEFSVQDESKPGLSEPDSELVESQGLPLNIPVEDIEALDIELEKLPVLSDPDSDFAETKSESLFSFSPVEEADEPSNHETPEPIAPAEPIQEKTSESPAPRKPKPAMPLKPKKEIPKPHISVEKDPVKPEFLELEIEIDENHILIEDSEDESSKARIPETPKKPKTPPPPKATEGQITLEFE